MSRPSTQESKQSGEHLLTHPLLCCFTICLTRLVTAAATSRLTMTTTTALMVDKELFPLLKAPEDRSDSELESLMRHTASFNYFQGVPPAIHKELCRFARIEHKKRGEIGFRQNE
jgi:hypothetical protein